MSKDVVLDNVYHKVLNIILLVSFILAKLIDYVITYIMIALGCSEGNFIVRYCLKEFGNVYGLFIAFLPSLFLSFVVMYYIITSNVIRKQHFACFVLILLIFYCLVIALGNTTGLALIIHKVL